MKIQLLILVMLCICGIGKAQKELQIEYCIKSGEYPYTCEVSASLRANAKYVHFWETAKHLVVVNTDEPYRVKSICNEVFKDVVHNSFQAAYSNERIVKESMNQIQWNFLAGKDSLLNYSCKKAKAIFRGREFIAWFTTELPFRAAPWKIHGLPGVILKLKTSDDFYNIEAKSVSVKNKNKPILLPFKTQDNLTWNEYVDIYKEGIEETKKITKSLEIKYGRKYYRSYPKLEIIIEENRETVDEMTSKIIDRQSKGIE
jgi:hypothetical protein